MTMDDFAFSLCYGSGVYEKTARTLGTDAAPGSGLQNSPVFRNIHTGEEFFVRTVDGDALSIERYRALVLKAPAEGMLMWPVDLVELGSISVDAPELSLARIHSDAGRNEGLAPRYALLFRMSDAPTLPDLRTVLEKTEDRSWKNKELMKLVCSLLHCLQSLIESGYSYQDMDLSRFYVTEDRTVRADLSPLLYSFHAFSPEQPESAHTFEPGTYPLEFADPSVISEGKSCIDVYSQLISLAAMLFFLLFGRLPYDGRLLAGYTDDDILSHTVRFTAYHKMPVFIFDPDDTVNRIGISSSEQQIAQLWTDCPASVREMFLRALREDNVLRRGELFALTPEGWLRCFAEAGLTQNARSEV